MKTYDKFTEGINLLNAALNIPSFDAYSESKDTNVRVARGKLKEAWLEMSVENKWLKKRIEELEGES